jgi:hypothetical protein
MCCKKISNDKRIDDVIVIIDKNFKFTILFVNKFLIIKKKIAKRMSNIDLIKIILPTVVIFFNVLTMDKKKNANIK